MSRRKQAKPQQVDHLNLLTKSTVSSKAITILASDELSTFYCDPQSAVLFQTRARQTQSELLNQNERLILLSREAKENKAEEFAFFPAAELNKSSMSDQDSSVSIETASESKKLNAMEQISAEPLKMEENSGKEDHNDDLGCVKSELVQEFQSEASPGSREQTTHESGTVTDQSKEEMWKKENSEINLSSSNDSKLTNATFQRNSIEAGEDVFDAKTEDISCKSVNSNEAMKQLLSENGHINREALMHSSPDSEKENFTAAKMMVLLNQSQDVANLEKPSGDFPEEGKELEKIKDQVRILQQQQMYQVQMLNCLQFQLNVMASHPQSQQKSPGNLPPGALNGFQLQNMPQLLAAAASMTGSGLPGPRTSTTSFFPSMSAAIYQQLNSNKAGEIPQQIFGGVQDAMDKKFDFLKFGGDSQSSSQNESTSKNDSYNPLSSLALLQNASQIRPTASEVLTNHSRDNIENEDTYLKHVCRFCQKAFGSDSALQIHLRSHTGERPYKCNICANRFSTKGNLKVHFVRHKERYPDIEMNPNPVPEYLDNIPTSSGIPYGMSIVPDVLDSKEQPTGEHDEDSTLSYATKRAVELPMPYRCLDNQKSFTDHLSKFNQKTGSENSKTTENLERSPISNIEIDPGNLSSRFPPTLVPFANTVTIRDCIEEQRSALSVSPSASDKGLRNVSSELSNDSNDPQVMISHKPTTSSSETSKLQQLVEQIDRGKELDKNECHICHRILSCQSALKLHYRTHTGERPYKCDLCSRAFTTRGNLRTHYSSVHRQQLQNITSEHMGARANALQCPLCGSRFMDQQSFQQHMQMHLYMHSQQQQALQLMNGQGGTPAAPDYRMLGMVNGSFPTNLAADRQFLPNEADNDEVFVDNPNDKKDDLKPNNFAESLSPAATVEMSSAASKSMTIKSQSKSRDENASCQSDLTKSSEQNDINSSSIFSKQMHSVNASEGALDLSRPSSNSSSSNGDTKMSSPGSPRDIPSNESQRISMETPLNVLASIASNDAAMRLNGISSANLPTTSIKDDLRMRKMTTACEICNKPFTCQSALEIHLRSHTKERPFLCRVCERGFTTKGNLKQHLLTHNITDVDEDMLEPVSSPLNGNPNSNSPSIPSTSQSSSFNQLKYIKCDPAFLRNSSQNSLKRHLETSPAAPPAKKTYPRHWCHICQKQFSSASSLQIHNRTHTGEKPFACSVCGRAFTTKGNLKVHMGTHVWGAGGSRRGRRISMDNPLISPWMQNTTNTNPTNAPLRPRVPPQLPPIPDQAAIYQQYAAIASGLMGGKSPSGDPRFHNNAVMNLNLMNNAAAKLLSSNNLPISTAGTAPSDVKSTELPGKEEPNKTMAEIATEWIWNAYKKSQEQDVN